MGQVRRKREETVSREQADNYSVSPSSWVTSPQEGWTWKLGKRLWMRKSRLTRGKKRKAEKEGPPQKERRKLPSKVYTKRIRVRDGSLKEG